MDAERIITQLHEIASPAVQEVIALGAQKNITEGWIVAVFGSMLVALTIYGAIALSKKNSDFSDSDKNTLIACAFIVSICLGVVVIHGVLLLANPEYYAIRELLRSVN